VTSQSIGRLVLAVGTAVCFMGCGASFQGKHIRGLSPHTPLQSLSQSRANTLAVTITQKDHAKAYFKSLATIEAQEAKRHRYRRARYHRKTSSNHSWNKPCFTERNTYRCRNSACLTQHLDGLTPGCLEALVKSRLSVRHGARHNIKVANFCANRGGACVAQVTSAFQTMLDTGFGEKGPCHTQLLGKRPVDTKALVQRAKALQASGKLWSVYAQCVQESHQFDHIVKAYGVDGVTSPYTHLKAIAGLAQTARKGIVAKTLLPTAVGWYQTQAVRAVKGMNWRQVKACRRASKVDFKAAVWKSGAKGQTSSIAYKVKGLMKNSRWCNKLIVPKGQPSSTCGLSRKGPSMGLAPADLKGLCKRAFDQSDYVNLVDREMKKRWKMNRAELEKIRVHGAFTGRQAYGILVRGWKKQGKRKCAFECKLFHKPLCCKRNWGRLGCNTRYSVTRYYKGIGYKGGGGYLTKKYKKSDPRKHRRCDNDTAARCGICR
jgi:hypothetical protein